MFDVGRKGAWWERSTWPSAESRGREPSKKSMGRNTWSKTFSRPT